MLGKDDKAAQSAEMQRRIKDVPFRPSTLETIDMGFYNHIDKVFDFAHVFGQNRESVFTH